MLTLAHRMMLGAASRPKNDARIISFAGTSGASDFAGGIDFDAYGNALIGARKTGESTLVKINPEGSVVWQRKLTLATTLICQWVKVNPATGDVYVAGEGRPSGSINAAYIAKYNASGVLQWQRKVSAAFSVSPINLAIDTSGDVFLVCRTSGASPGLSVIVKYSPGGVQQWRSVLSQATDISFRGGVVFDASGNLLIGATTYASGTGTWAGIVKCTSAGVVSANYLFKAASNTVAGLGGIAIDGSGNVFCAGNMIFSGTPKAAVWKINSSGVLQWARHITVADSSGNNGFSAVALDGAGRVYAIRTSGAFAFSESDGALVWQRSLRTSAESNPGVQMIHRDARLGFVTSINISGNLDSAFVSLPDDGEGLGTYGTSIVYAEATHTNTSFVPITDTATLTHPADTFSEAAGDMTEAAGDLTPTTQVKTA